MAAAQRGGPADLTFVAGGFAMVALADAVRPPRAPSLRVALKRIGHLAPAYRWAMIPLIALAGVASLVAHSRTGEPLAATVWALADSLCFSSAFAFALAFDRRWCVPLVTAWGGATLALAAAVAPLHNVYLDVYAGAPPIAFTAGALAAAALWDHFGL